MSGSKFFLQKLPVWLPNSFLLKSSRHCNKKGTEAVAIEYSVRNVQEVDSLRGLANEVREG